MRVSQEEYNATIARRNAFTKEIATLSQMDREEAEQHEDHREALSIDIQKQYTILLTCGGPSEGVDLYFNEYNELLRGEFWSTYETQGETVRTDLTNEQAQAIADYYNVIVE